MAIKSLKPGKITAEFRTRLNPNHDAAKIFEAPGGMYPLRMACYEIDEYRIRDGWPVPVPGFDIHSVSSVNCEGYALEYRDSAHGVATGAIARWIADEDDYNLDALSWYPIQAIRATWSADSEYAPVFLNNYEYLIDRDTKLGNALNFDADDAQHLTCDISAAIGGAAGYSVIMVGNFNSVFGNSEQPYAGLWAPAQATPDGGWFELTLRGNSLWLETDQTPAALALSIKPLLDETVPVMIAVCFARPFAKVYAARGPGKIDIGSVYTGDSAVTLDGRVALGRTKDDLEHCSDMALMELGIYPDNLTRDQVVDEFALLSSIYGGD